ncbi:unnamed protein product [Peniophora sp. CBMAI 1063]|nr:unnamed protein product [Peniophora sp. CBMAI 1063]
MTTKSTPSPAHLATSALFTPPVPVTPESSVLAADVPLPPNTVVLYKVWRPTTPDALEAARRTVTTLRASAPESDILGNVLFSISMERGAEQLYVFAVDASEGQARARKQLAELKLDNMDVMESASFTPDGIFPCSRACAAQRAPCPSCLSSTSSAVPTPSSSSSTSLSASATLLPRQHLRLPYAYFLRSLANALSEEMCSGSTPQLRMCRFRDGLALFPPVAQGGWGIGWEHHGTTRALVNCTFDVSLSLDRILFTPQLRASTYKPFEPETPPDRGAPIILLPNGTPAYYLSDYTGPRSALTEHYRAALADRCCGPWDSSINSPSSAASSSGSENGKECESGNPLYVVAWIVVQNKHGEDKGVAVVWPASLTLAHIPSLTSGMPASASTFTPLAYTPVLPPELQSAPPAPAAPAPNSLASASTEAPPPQSTLPLPERVRPATTPGVRSVGIFALALHTPGQADVKRVATTVGTFVDEAVKQRDAEIQKRREASAASSTTATSGGAASGSSRTAGRPSVSTSASPAAASMAAATATSAVTAGQPFYPSPVTSGAPTNPQPEPVPPPIPIPEPQTQTQPTTFDTFDGFDTFGDWGNGDYLTSGMNGLNTGMDMNMNLSGQALNMNMNMDLGNNTNLNAPNDLSKNSWDLGGSDDIFTDADFDFWGASAPAPKPAPRPSLSLSTSGGTGLTPGAGPAPLGGMFDHVAASGPGPPSASAMTPSASAWLPPSTPTNLVLPSSISVSFDPTPLTAVLQPSMSPERPVVEQEPESFQPPLATDGYGPISFAPTLAARDGKYAEGKFAFTGGLPSPPEEDMLPYTPTSSSLPAPTPRRASASFVNGSALLPPRVSSLSAPRPSMTTRASSLLAPTPRSATYSATLPSTPSATSISAPAPVPWHLRYTAATDPRPRIVRALKRKATGQGLRDRPRSNSAAWHDVWEDDLDDEDEEEVPATSDEESSDDDESEEGEGVGDEGQSRARTPLPAYLSAGPSLLASNFSHAYLLSLASQMRPVASTPFASSASTPPATGAASVPTPVSPAALMGAASEKAKSLEAAAQLLAREVVESAVWAEAWEASALCEDDACKAAQREVWPADIARVLSALQRVRGLRAPVNLATALIETPRRKDGEDVVMGDSSQSDAAKLQIKTFGSMALAVSKGSAIIAIQPSALRFWHKLGLGPRSGPKDVVAYVFFEDVPDGRMDLAGEWLKRLGETYKSANLGKHTPGRAAGCARDGIVPVHFDTFRKTLTEFVGGLESTTTNYVFYIVAPARITTLSSPVLRQVFSAVKRAQKAYCEAQILFQFLPVHLVFSPHQRDQLYFACSVYDRVARPADRAMSRRFFDHGPRVRTLVREPAFAIAPGYPYVNFNRDHPIQTLNVVYRQSFLHVAYGVAGRWLVAAASDERGTAHDLEVWALQEPEPAHFIASTVWSFAKRFATRASTDWRMFIIRAGMMGAEEVNAWADTIELSLPAITLPMHVSLAVYETACAPAFLPGPTTLPPSSSVGVKQILADGGLRVYALPRISCAALAAPLTDDVQPFVQDPSRESAPATPSHTQHTNSSASPAPIYNSFSSAPHPEYLRPLRSAAFVHAPTNGTPALARIHVLYETASAHATFHKSKARSLEEELVMFNALSTLALARGMQSEGLPWHLAAVRVMATALSAVNAGE